MKFVKFILYFLAGVIIVSILAAIFSDDDENESAPIIEQKLTKNKKLLNRILDTGIL